MTTTARRTATLIPLVILGDLDESGTCHGCGTRTDDLYPRETADGDDVEVCADCTVDFIYFKD